MSEKSYDAAGLILYKFMFLRLNAISSRLLIIVIIATYGRRSNLEKTVVLHCRMVVHSPAGLWLADPSNGWYSRKFIRDCCRLSLHFPLTPRPLAGIFR